MHRKQKFVIVSPRVNGGGPTVLHVLCKCLTELGYNAKMFYVKDFAYHEEKKEEYWKNYWMYLYSRILGKWYPDIRDGFCDWEDSFKQMSVKGCKQKYFPFVGKNTIVIYPEVIYGNPFGAPKVVRWLLYHYKYYGDEKAYDKDDVFVAYREVFNDKRLNPMLHKLYLLYFDLGLYKQTNFGERKGNCYIIRKGKKRKDLPLNFEGDIIDDLLETEKVKKFNECKYCICYDTQTAYATLAAICGCIPIVIPEEGKTRNDYYTAGDVSYGIAFGFEESEIEYAVQTRSELLRKCQEINIDSLEEVKKFIELCNDIF